MDVLDALLYTELTLEEKLYLGSMARQPGFTVFKKLVDEAFKKAMSTIVELSPEDSEYETKLKARQLEIHVTKKICSALIKSINMHAEAAEVERRVQKLREEEEKATEKDPALVGKFGNIKTRKGELSNTQ